MALRKNSLVAIYLIAVIAESCQRSVELPTPTANIQPMWTKRVAANTGGRDPLGLSRVAFLINRILQGEMKPLNYFDCVLSVEHWPKLFMN